VVCIGTRRTDRGAGSDQASVIHPTRIVSSRCWLWQRYTHVQSCPFADGVFDAAVAWGVMFHLNPEDAIRAIANVSRIVKRGALFLFTAGDVDGFDSKDGKMNGVTFRYFSYSIHSYRRILGDHGFTLVDVHADSGNNTYYLAKKAEPPR
jgi:SAM-dependent methyltransferase